jgi:hypothetical protein
VLLCSISAFASHAALKASSAILYASAALIGTDLPSELAPRLVGITASAAIAPAAPSNPHPSIPASMYLWEGPAYCGAGW